MKRNYKRYRYEPQPSVSDPRRYLLAAVLAFVREAKSLPGVLRIALVGSLATDKPVPKDADVLVSIDASMDLSPLARIGRRLQGTAQQINLGGDVFWQTNRADISGASATIGNATPAVCAAIAPPAAPSTWK